MLKDVTKEEFFKFIENYPNLLDTRLVTMTSPPMVCYEDFSKGNWPKCTVGQYRLGGYYDDGPEDYDYRIVEEE